MPLKNMWIREASFGESSKSARDCRELENFLCILTHKVAKELYCRKCPRGNVFGLNRQ